MTRLPWYRLRLRVLILAAVLVAAPTLYVVWRVHLATRELPVGTGPAGPAVASTAFTGVWTERPVVLLGLGDSITRGYGVEAHQSYFGLLVRNDDIGHPDMAGCDLASVLPALEVHNFAVDYATTREHTDAQLPRIPTYPPATYGIVVITSGGNDLIHDYGRTQPRDGAMYGAGYRDAVPWVDAMQKRLAAIIAGVAAKFPGGCDVFLANIYDPTDGVGDPQIVGLPRWRDSVRILRLANQRIAELCSRYENVHVVDIHGEFLGHGLHCTEGWRRTYHRDDPTHWYDRNIEDPNIRGYDAIRRLFLNEMGRVCRDRLAQNHKVEASGGQ